MKVYLSGPMSGIPAFNIPLFDLAAATLRGKGISVVSPAELDTPEFRDLCEQSVAGDIVALQGEAEARGMQPETWGDLLARDVKLLADDGIEAIVCLSGWTRSKGARLETFVGRLVGLPILVYPSLRPASVTALQSAHGWPSDTIPVGFKQFYETTTWAGRKELTDEMLKPNQEPINPKMDPGIESLPRTRGPIVPALPKSGTPKDSMQEGPPKGTGLTGGERAKRRAEAELMDARTVQEYHKHERGEVRVTNPTTGGEKGAKPERYDLIPWEQMDEVARLYGWAPAVGKYKAHNWTKGYDWSLSFNSLVRHIRAFWWEKESVDPETGCHHLASAVFHCLALMFFEKHHSNLDDRR